MKTAARVLLALLVVAGAGDAFASRDGHRAQHRGHDRPAVYSANR